MIDHYLHSGGYFIRGGSRALIDGYLRAIERGGGKVRLRSRVEQIIVEDGRAVGVRLAKGGELRASLVVSNADAKRTLLELVGEDYLSPATVQRLREYRMALPLFIIYMAMQVPPEAAGSRRGFHGTSMTATARPVAKMSCRRLSVSAGRSPGLRAAG